MSELTPTDVENKTREAYLQGFKDGVTRSCEYYDATLRELSRMSFKKLIERIDVVFKVPDENVVAPESNKVE
jgi:hypothetical protein